jgi:anti-sigma regulatory factor (Ser/Thr protein kinase)
MDQLAMRVSEASEVGAARRAAAALATMQGLGEHYVGQVSLAVTEAATNLIKHGGGGRIFVRPLSAASRNGVEVIALDKGKGMPSVPQSMRDGHSTAGSPGLGLGTLSRISAGLDIFSQPEFGTALRFEIWDTIGNQATAELEAGVICTCKSGETVCGDAWSVHSERGRYVAVVADGLGHGPEAAAAAQTALESVSARPQLAPAEQLSTMHLALRPTRGAAVAVVELQPSRGMGTFCGVGNISGVVRAAGKSRSLVSHNGTLGHHMRKTQEFAFPYPPGALLIMHSDGVSARWDLDRYRGLEMRHPSLVAAVLYRDFQRGTDDATVAVFKNRSAVPQ